jgi:hypothetical protein
MVMFVTSFVKKEPTFLQPQASMFEALAAHFARNRKRKICIFCGKPMQCRFARISLTDGVDQYSFATRTEAVRPISISSIEQKV